MTKRRPGKRATAKADREVDSPNDFQNTRETDRAIGLAVDFISKEQRKDGAFWCLVSTKLDDYSDSHAKRVPAIVPTNMVLSSLNKLDSGAFPKIDLIKKRAADFLINEKGEYWSYNYWFRKSGRFKREPYPDDTDDTFCALAALHEYDPSLFDGETMASIITMLTSSEKGEGGPYDMWLVPPDGRDTWSDLDLVCNCNIAFFLSLEGISLPKVNAFIEKSIDEDGYEFPYNKMYPGIYFVSRFYKGKKRQKIIDLLISRQERSGAWENPLRTALAISSLINLSGFSATPEASGGMDSSRDYSKHDYSKLDCSEIISHIEKGIACLIKSQKTDGSWPAYSFYYQMKTPQKTLFAGSAAMTTALCIEALNNATRVEEFLAELARPSGPRKPNASKEKTATFQASDIEARQIEGYKKIYKSVTQIVKKRFDGYTSLKHEAYSAIDMMLKGDKASSKGGVGDEIVLLPYLFRDSLSLDQADVKNGIDGERPKITDSMLIKLGSANLYGWLAYTIYDDFLDEEGDSRMLSVANVCHREAVLIFNSIGGGFVPYVLETLDTIDDANAWEALHCRFDINKHPAPVAIPNFGNYAQLAHRSLGHTLGPAAILFMLSYEENLSKFFGVMNFFKHYIIARQLNDDAHDWEDDLRRGQVNSVSALILSDSKLRNSELGVSAVSGSGVSINIGLDVDKDMDALRQTFWNRTIVTVCRETLHQVALSRKNLKQSGMIKNPKIFEKMLSRIEKLVKITLEEREEMLKFLARMAAKKIRI